MQRTQFVGALRPLAAFVLIAVAPFLFSRPASAQGFVGVSLDLASQTVPPGGLLQMQVFITEPKPILKGGQKTTFSSHAAFVPALRTVRDGALFSPAGDVDGVAVFAPGSIQINF